MCDQVFLLPQVKGRVIISNNHGIYKLPHDLPNYLRGGAYVPTQEKKKKDLES